MRTERGVTVIELTAVLAILAVGIGVTAPYVGRLLPTLRTKGAAQDLYAAVHLTRARARATAVMHALVIEPGGRGFRIVEDPAGEARTVIGPTELLDGVVVSGNSTIRFSPRGFAVPAGTITVYSDGEVWRVIVNILGRARLDSGPAPS